MYRLSMHYDGPMSYLVNLISVPHYQDKFLEVDRVLNRLITAHFASP
jgi:hypothetical protein